MKSLIVPLLATASFSTFLICGMVAASSLHLGYTPHKFANINASIWTSTPVVVDRSEQAFLREPALAPVQATTGEPESDVASTQVISNPVENASFATDSQQIATSTATDNTGWCQARYKSYRTSDNTYQPFDGGPRRPCEAPGTPTLTGAATSDSSGSAVAQNADQSHTGWCEARYSSYRPSDDTYQPFDSAERRRCMSPVSMASNG